MKKLSLASIALVALNAGAAIAADLPVQAPAYRAPAVVLFSWTGFYVGGHGGYAWTHKQWHEASDRELVSYTAEGGIWGVQGGYNWQSGGLVIGVEAQASWSDVRKGAPYLEQDNIVGPAGRVTRGRVGTTVENIGTVALRLGHAWDRSLFYVKGGAAWAYEVFRAFDAGVPGEPLLASASDTRWGWMVGIGYEYAFLGNWSAKIEYDFLGFGRQRIDVGRRAGRHAVDAAVRRVAGHFAGQGRHQLPLLRRTTGNPGKILIAGALRGRRAHGVELLALDPGVEDARYFRIGELGVEQRDLALALGCIDHVLLVLTDSPQRRHRIDAARLRTGRGFARDLRGLRLQLPHLPFLLLDLGLHGAQLPSPAASAPSAWAARGCFSSPLSFFCMAMSFCTGAGAIASSRLPNSSAQRPVLRLGHQVHHHRRGSRRTRG